MADTKISAMPALAQGDVVVGTDVLPIVDIGPPNLNKTITPRALVGSAITDLVQTWNAGGTTFNAIKMNVMDTASAAASLLLDLQVGGTSQFRVSKGGAVSVGSTIELGHASDTTLARGSAGVLTVEGNTVYTSSNLPGTVITWTGAQTFGANVFLDSALPQIQMRDSGGSVGNQRWGWYAVNSAMHWQAISDDLSTGTVFFQAVRSGQTITSVNLTASSVLANGNTIYHAGNLPGTAITWTGLQTFTNSGGASILLINTGANTSYAESATFRISQNAGGTNWLRMTVAQVDTVTMGIEAADQDNVKRTLRLNPYGGSVEIGGPNTVYHTGNLPGTAITWTASQTWTASNNRLQNDQAALVYANTAGTNRWIVGVRNDITGNTEDFIFFNSSLVSTAATIDLTNDEFLFRVAPKVGGNTVYHAGNLPGTAITWTALQTFSSNLSVGAPLAGPHIFVYDNANATLGLGNDMSGAFYELALFAGGNSDTLGRISFGRRRSDTGTYTERMVLNVATGVLTIDGNTVYHAGNLPGTAITWTASQTFGTLVSLSSITPKFVFDRTNSAADNRRWDILDYDEALRFRAVNDADTAATDWCRVDRTGTTIDEIELNATTLDFNGTVDVSAHNIATDITTGTKIGTATNQKLGFFNATPVVQPTAVADATDAASVITQLNALLSRMRTLGLIAT